MRAPAIIGILADDLGFNDIMVNGGGVANGALPTPNTDALLRQGVQFSNGGERFAPNECMTDCLIMQAVDAIRAKRKRPLFMNLAFNAPHTPLQTKRYDLTH